MHGEGFVRISYATSMDNIKKACERIEHFLDVLDAERKQRETEQTLEIIEEIIEITE